MRPVIPLPDDELALIQYLGTVTEVTALVPASRVSTALGPRPVYPVVLIQRVMGDETNAPQWIDAAVIQVDVLATDKRTAKVLMQTVRAAILAIENDHVAEGWLVSSYEEIGPQWLPDTLSTPPLSRYIARFRVLIHP